jgi:hypothetical protein
MSLRFTLWQRLILFVIFRISRSFSASMAKHLETCPCVSLESPNRSRISKQQKRSVRTIEDNRSHLMGKLGIDNVVDLVKLAPKMNFED